MGLISSAWSALYVASPRKRPLSLSTPTTARTGIPSTSPDRKLHDSNHRASPGVARLSAADVEMSTHTTVALKRHGVAARLYAIHCRTVIEVFCIVLLGTLSLSLSLPVRAQEVQEEEVRKACALGYCMGDDMDLEEEGDDSGVSYATVTHPAFDLLMVYWTADQGVCQLSGYDVISNPDNYGVAHRATFDRFKDLVVGKHGEPSGYLDVLSPDSMWKESRQWLMGLEKGHRKRMAVWRKGVPYEEMSKLVESLRKRITELSPNLGEANVGAELSTEGLHAISIRAKSALVSVTYQFDNITQCIEEGKAKIGADF